MEDWRWRIGDRGLGIRDFGLIRKWGWDWEQMQLALRDEAGKHEQFKKAVEKRLSEEN